MPAISINLNEVPDKILPVSVGLRTLEVENISQDTNDKGEVVLSATFKVVDENNPDEVGRKVFDNFNLKYLPAQVKFKNLITAAGLDASGNGFDTEQLIGKTVIAEIAPNTWKDKDTGEIKENTKLKAYKWEK